ncbi:hypothetical protein [Halobacillus seohaensis]
MKTATIEKLFPLKEKENFAAGSSLKVDDLVFVTTTQKSYD